MSSVLIRHLPGVKAGRFASPPLPAGIFQAPLAALRYPLIRAARFPKGYSGENTPPIVARPKLPLSAHRQRPPKISPRERSPLANFEQQQTTQL